MRFSEKFEALFNPPKGVRYFIITGGRFSSKSYAVSTAAAKLTSQDNHRILYTRYTLSSASDSIIPEFQEKIDILGLGDYFHQIKDRIIGTHNSSKIVFKGLKTSSGNQTAKLKSLKDFSIFILDEAEEENDETSFDKINLSIRANDVPNLAILILNPTTKEHWIYKRFFEDRGVPDGFNGQKDDVYYIHSTYEDCIDYVPEDMLRIFEHTKKTNPEKYKHVILGGWLPRAEGVIFDNWEEGEFDESLPDAFGLDFGYTLDPDSLIRVAIDKKKMKMYLQEKMYSNGQGVEKLKKELGRFVHNNKMIVADSAEPRLIDELRRGGFNMRSASKRPGSIGAGIKLLQDYRLIVDSNSINLKKELNNYCWSDKSGEVPIDDYNHLLDALRYITTELLVKKTVSRQPRATGRDFRM